MMKFGKLTSVASTWSYQYFCAWGFDILNQNFLYVFT